MQRRAKQQLGRVRRFMTFSHWPPVVTAGLLGFDLGLGANYMLTGTAIDGGIATILATITTIAGSLWIVQYQANARERPFERFVAEAAASIRDETHVLLKLIEIDSWPEPALQAANLKDQVERLHEALRFFQKNSPYLQIRSYGVRLAIGRLKDEIQDGLLALEREVAWLEEHPTANVVQYAKRNLSLAARGLLKGCEELCRQLGLEKPVPSDDEVAQRIESLARVGQSASVAPDGERFRSDHPTQAGGQSRTWKRPML
jgi:hypothetical protein